MKGNCKNCGEKLGNTTFGHGKFCSFECFRADAKKKHAALSVEEKIAKAKRLLDYLKSDECKKLQSEIDAHYMEQTKKIQEGRYDELEMLSTRLGLPEPMPGWDSFIKDKMIKSIKKIDSDFKDG